MRHSINEKLYRRRYSKERDFFAIRVCDQNGLQQFNIRMEMQRDVTRTIFSGANFVNHDKLFVSELTGQLHVQMN